MYELRLGIAHLKFRGLNFAVWVAMEFEFGNWLKFQAKSPCVILASHISKLPRSELARIVKISKKIKTVKNPKTLKSLKK
jgi:hypothetical protein